MWTGITSFSATPCPNETNPGLQGATCSLATSNDPMLIEPSFSTFQNSETPLRGSVTTNTTRLSPKTQMQPRTVAAAPEHKYRVKDPLLGLPERVAGAGRFGAIRGIVGRSRAGNHCVRQVRLAIALAIGSPGGRQLFIRPNPGGWGKQAASEFIRFT